MYIQPGLRASEVHEIGSITFSVGPRRRPFAAFRRLLERTECRGIVPRWLNDPPEEPQPQESCRGEAYRKVDGQPLAASRYPHGLQTFASSTREGLIREPMNRMARSYRLRPTSYHEGRTSHSECCRNIAPAMAQPSEVDRRPPPLLGGIVCPHWRLAGCQSLFGQALDLDSRRGSGPKSRARSQDAAKLRRPPGSKG
jgi:hypothetical protein